MLQSDQMFQGAICKVANQKLIYQFLAYLWCAYAIPMALSYVRQQSNVS